MKKLLSVMLLTVGIILSSQFVDVPNVSAVQCPIRGSNFTYYTQGDHHITISVNFVIENISDYEVHISANDFVLRKIGHNAVKPERWGGGFSKNLNPGDVTDVALEYYVDDFITNGWKLYYSNFGNRIVLFSING